jgi:Leucine-rich repeat (LRR) protein
LESLEEINFGGNTIERIPDSIGDLKNLKYLNLAGNKIRELPESFTKNIRFVE